MFSNSSNDYYIVKNDLNSMNFVKFNEEENNNNNYVNNSFQSKNNTCSPFPTKCCVCGYICSGYVHYNVVCCDVAIKCKSCRFDKCVLVGMRIQTIRGVYAKSLPEIYELLEQKRNELRAEGKYLENSVTKSKTNIKERGAISLEAIGFVLKNGFFKTPPLSLMEDLLLIVDIGKTMPSFNDLDLSDKITMPLSILLVAYYSYTKKYNAVILPTGSGLSMAFGFSGEYYRGDKTIAKLSKKVFTDSMGPFNRVQLTEEEYVLLRAIIFCHSFTDGLSKQGRELLLNESEKYSKILMKILQNRHGDLAGARRFTECVQLIQACFFFGHQHSLFFNYLANVYHRDTFRNVMPEAFVNLCLRNKMNYH
uniref:NR LBD domain-containing protein n=1 Tax=Meloidogyne javanica TaxID=6303 RepID=A0A915NA47_MELJA